MTQRPLRKAVVRAITPGALSGITISQWVRLLWENRFAVELRYFPRAVSISMISLLNSVLGCWELSVYSRHWKKTEVMPPLIVLGAARCGTTYLQNLLCEDTRFAYPSFLQTRFPLIFLSAGWLVRRLGSFAMTKHRRQDRVDVGWDRPGEDESALCALTLHSRLLGTVFPKHRARYERYSFSDGFTEDQAQKWKAVFLAYVQKLTWKYNKPLVLKTPAHTARIRLLLEAFPEARFVFIQRNPFNAIRSSMHMSQEISPYRRLQTPPERSEDFAAERFRKLMEAYFDQRKLIACNRLHEIRFEDLERNPIGTLREIYEALDLPDFGVTEDKVLNYLDSIADYKKNKHDALPHALREQIAKECSRCFEEWDYPIKLQAP